jgi:NAD(P)-dependent dehydrogenase (short-subunit alcohol dehydrogenase family)
MPRELCNAVVVITGASSGIGLCAAHRFAEHGCRLILAARGTAELEQAVAECRVRGAEAYGITTDVRVETEVHDLATAAVDHFGRIDVWINNAGVIAYGRFEDVPSDVFRGVIETNLMGQVHGARAVLPHFRSRGDGVLINLASVWARVSTPDVSAYVTSKFAVRAFSECLREELADTPGIEVSTILPEAVDTPIFDNAANYGGRRPRPIPPLVPPDQVAQGIVRCAQNPKHEVTYGSLGRGAELLHSTLPWLYQRTVPGAFAAGNYSSEPADSDPGNVLEPRGTHAVDGHWRHERRLELVRALLSAAVGALRGLVLGPGR